ncbi:MAG: hypothetical protein R2727_01590 [Bacteroidales bacterium]
MKLFAGLIILLYLLGIIFVLGIIIYLIVAQEDRGRDRETFEKRDN